MSKTTASYSIATALGIALVALPAAFDGGSPVGAPSALAKDNGHGGGNGNGNGGGSGHGGGNGGNAGGHGQGHADAAGSHSGKGAKGDAAHDGEGALGDDPTAPELGRLNGFLHASAQGRANAAPGSAVGLVSHGYAEALQAYLDSGDAADPTPPDDSGETDTAEDPLGQRDPLLLSAAGAILGDAANKPLSPGIVALINRELGLDSLTEAEVEALLDAAEPD